MQNTTLYYTSTHLPIDCSIQVIAIRDDQLTRVNWIKYPENQLSFNPFEAIDSSYEVGTLGPGMGGSQQTIRRVLMH